MRQLDGIPNSMDRNLNELWEILKDRKAWHAGVHGVSKSQLAFGLNNKQIYRNTNTYQGWQTFSVKG